MGISKKLTALISCAALCAVQLSGIGSYKTVKAADDTYLIRDKWGYCTTANYAESEHFVIFYGNNDTTGEVNEAFLKRNLEDYEKLWHCYGEYLGMTEMNSDIYGKSQQKYKTNVYLTYTGLDRFSEGWAFMSSEDGYGIEIISPKAMLDDLTIAHEFGHVATLHQKAWVDQDITGAWWEPLANWFREMYLGSDYYPVSITMENIAFDMSELLSSLSSEDTGDISMDMTMNMTLNFSNWGGVSDDEVAVPEAALSAE